jgi:hypothetical protein
MERIYGDHRVYEDFFYSFRSSVLSKEVEKVSSHINYPLNWYSADGVKTIDSKEQFIEQYHNIFTTHLYSIVNDQKFESLFAKDAGVMFGQGEVWFSGVCVNEECKKVIVKVTAINTRL